MKILRLCGAFLLLVGVGACGGSNTKTVRVWLGPDATEEDALAATEELGAAVLDVFETEGFTSFEDLPVGSPVYSGIIAGEEGGGDGPLVNYIADLRLTADFGASTVDGTISNFLTTLPGFDDPNGTINVNGTIQSDSFGDATVNFIGSGGLVQGSVAAEYDVWTIDGYFGGTTAQALIGEHETEFFWVSAPTALDDGTISWSDGGYLALKN